MSVVFDSFLAPFCLQSCFGRNLVIDPMVEEEACQDGSLMIACMPSRHEITQLTLTGEWSTAKINEVYMTQYNTICIHA